MSNIPDILNQRETTYGDFESLTRLSQTLQNTFFSHYMRTSNNTPLPPHMVEALMMIFHKLSRIANGNPYYVDSWTDIGGYSQLVVDILNKQQLEKDSNVS